jgi:large subunit ribosomal protein L10
LNREQKEAAVADLAERLKEAQAIFAVDYRGISVPEAAELRSKLAEADASFRIVKNRLTKLATAGAGVEVLDEALVGPTALALIHGDPVTAAKAIFTFSRQHNVLEFKTGIMDGEPVDAERFVALARLPALDVMHGQLVGMTASPLTGLVRGLGSMLAGLAVALKEMEEKGLVQGEAEAPAEAPTEAEAAEEPPAEPEEAEAPAEPEEEEAPAEEAVGDEPVVQEDAEPSPAETEEPSTDETENESEEQ